MRPDPPNAFAFDFRQRMNRRDEPETAHEAETAGAAEIVPIEEGFAVLRDGERLDEGDPPVAVLADRSLALLVAAALPASGRNPTYGLAKEAAEQGYPIRADGRIVGHLSRFDPNLLAAANAFDHLVRSPRALAQVLAASGGLALERAGRILERLTRPEPTPGEGAEAEAPFGRPGPGSPGAGR